MKVMITHSDEGQRDRINIYAKQLLFRALDSYRHKVRSVDVKLDPGTDIKLGEFNYLCTILICMTNGQRIKANAQDRDEILAIYSAVERIINLIVQTIRKS